MKLANIIQWLCLKNFNDDVIDPISQAIKVLSSDICTYSSIVKILNILINPIFKVYNTIPTSSSFGARIKEFVVATNSLKMRTHLSRNHLRFFLSTDVWAYACTYDITVLKFCLACDCNRLVKEMQKLEISSYWRTLVRILDGLGFSFQLKKCTLFGFRIRLVAKSGCAWKP